MATISREDIKSIAEKTADKIVKRECFNIIDRLGSVLINMGAAYSMELQGDRPRAKFWLNNGKGELDKLERDAPHLKETVEAIKEGLSKLAGSEPGGYSMVHNMVEFEVINKMSEDFNACQCRRTHRAWMGNYPEPRPSRGATKGA